MGLLGLKRRGSCSICECLSKATFSSVHSRRESKLRFSLIFTFAATGVEHRGSWRSTIQRSIRSKSSSFLPSFSSLFLLSVKLTARPSSTLHQPLRALSLLDISYVLRRITYTRRRRFVLLFSFASEVSVFLTDLSFGARSHRKEVGSPDSALDPHSKDLAGDVVPSCYQDRSCSVAE